MAEISQVAQLIKDAGLIHKGNIENVVMYELPEHPGKTFSAKAEQIEGVEWLKNHAKAKIDRYLTSDADYAKSIAAKITEAAHFAPGREAEIPGLIGKGAAKAMRKILTEFGSPWKGLGDEYMVQTQRSGLNRMMTIMKGQDTVGMLTYKLNPDSGVASVASSLIFEHHRGKGLGKGMYMEAFKHASSEGAIRFRSDETQSVSESAQALWRSAEAEGMATKIPGQKGWMTNLTTRQYLNQKPASPPRLWPDQVAPTLPRAEDLARMSLARGEGTAIARAGTSEVSATLRNTSRIIRNAL